MFILLNISKDIRYKIDITPVEDLAFFNRLSNFIEKHVYDHDVFCIVNDNEKLKEDIKNIPEILYFDITYTTNFDDISTHIENIETYELSKSGRDFIKEILKRHNINNDVYDRFLFRQMNILTTKKKYIERNQYSVVDYSEIGERIREERHKQNLTQEKLAEMAEISESFMGHIERGGRTLSIETLVKISNALNLNIEYIIRGEHNYKPDMLPTEIIDALNRMNASQRKVFLNMMKTLAAHSDEW